MADDYLSILPFARQTFTRSVNNYRQAIDGLTEEQVFYQPTSECNSIGWVGTSRGGRTTTARS